jgi:hypothetical protein
VGIVNKVFIIGLTLCGILYNSILHGQETFDFFKLQWKDDGVEIQEAHIDDKITIRFETKNVPENEIIDIEVWGKTDNKLMDLIKKLHGTVKNGIVEFEWVIEFDIENKETNYAHEIEENNYVIVDYIFLIKYNNITVSSKLLAILAWIDYQVFDETTGEPMQNRDFLIYGPDGKFIVGKTDDEGNIKVRNLRKIGNYKFMM